jgi:hypothetical protein
MFIQLALLLAALSCLTIAMGQHLSCTAGEAE